MSHTHLFAIYFIYWPNNASEILIIKAHAALVYFYLQASMYKWYNHADQSTTFLSTKLLVTKLMLFSLAHFSFCHVTVLW